MIPTIIARTGVTRYTESRNRAIATREDRQEIESLIMKEIRKKFYFGSNRRDAIFYAFHKLFPAAFHCYEYMHVFIVLVNYEIYEYPWSTDE